MEGLEWIPALRAPAIGALLESDALQLSLFDERDLFELTSPDYPGERLVACRNPLLAEERARKPQAPLKATEKELEKIAVATRREKRRLVGKDKIGLCVGKVLGKYKVGKHFELEIADDGFTCRRHEERIREEARLDGEYVIRTTCAGPWLRSSSRTTIGRARPPLRGGPGPAFSVSTREGAHQTHGRRLSRTQLGDAARGPGDADEEPDALRACHLPSAGLPDSTPDTRL